MSRGGPQCTGNGEHGSPGPCRKGGAGGLRWYIKTLAIALMAAYPFAIWFALHLNRPGLAALLVMAFAVASALRWRRRRGFLAVAAQAAGVAAISLLAVLLDDPRFLLQVPVLISLFMLAGFAWTLYRPPSMIERYAVMLYGTLFEGESAYCRVVTLVWIAFFIANATVAEALAMMGAMDAWALYSGGVAYIIMGAIFSVEYGVRSKRFPRPETGPAAWLKRVVSPDRDRETGC